MKADERRDETEAFLTRLSADAKASGYFLNPDEAFVRELAAGLLANLKRYGYASCPCRLAACLAEADRDIVCPCDYRDQDIADYGACYCALYVSEAAAKDPARIVPVPERRCASDAGPSTQPVRRAASSGPAAAAASPPVWRCRVCGYLCAREEPPDVCPICKVKKDRFEKFGGLIPAVA